MGDQMKLYAISDLHLSFGTDKPMNIFGKVWENYEEKIKQNWELVVRPKDVVLIPGDISWGINLKEALPDFKFIDALPGEKLILRGNHDYYFATKTKLERFLKENQMNSIKVLHNNAYDVGKYIVCGARGWGRTEGNDVALDKKIIAREEGRLRISLEEGKKIQQENHKEILVALHFPPFVGNFESILQEYQVKKCIYGHLHGYGHMQVKEGIIGGIEYVMVGCDYTNFELTEL